MIKIITSLCRSFSLCLCTHCSEVPLSLCLVIKKCCFSTLPISVLYVFLRFVSLPPFSPPSLPLPVLPSPPPLEWRRQPTSTPVAPQEWKESTTNVLALEQDSTRDSSHPYPPSLANPFPIPQTPWSTAQVSIVRSINPPLTFPPLPPTTRQYVSHVV